MGGTKLDTSTLKTHYEETSADDKSIGFEYQYYFFLFLILNLSEGQTIGLEVKDDIHIESSNKRNTLIQLKHSVQTNADGKIINLRERDIDLWKTIHNWISVIKDSNDGRNEHDKQIEFINSTDFVLVSNKAENTRNKFLVNVSDLKQGKIDVASFKTYLKELYDNTKELQDSGDKEKETKDSESKIKIYIKELELQEETLLEEFLKKIIFELSQDDLINKIKERIKKVKMIPENRVDDVFSKLDSKLRQQIYNDIKEKKKILLSCDDFYEEYKNCFSIGRVNRLPIRRIAYDLPQRLEDQRFIKQLLDIEAVDVADFESIAALTYHKLLMSNNLHKWIQESDLSSEEEKAFHEQSKLKWKNIFDSAHRKSKKAVNIPTLSQDEIEEVIKDNAFECLCQVRKIDLRIDETIFDTDMSNGEFYLLSDIPEIGWHLYWEGKYKDDE
jgi:hypothetical protein